MKQTIILLALVLTFIKSPADEALDKVHFTGAPLSLVLKVYDEASGMENVVSSSVKRLDVRIWLQVGPEVSKEEVLNRIEKAMLEQAGVVVTKLDKKRLSVTYNDALPVSVKTSLQ